MGSLKDETRSLKENCQSCEKTDDGGCPAGTDCNSGAEEALHTSQKSTNQEELQLNVDASVDSIEGTSIKPTSKDKVFEGVDCDDPAQSKNDTLSPIAQPTTDARNNTTVSFNLPNDEDPAEKSVTNKGKEAGIENITIPVPSTPGSSDPRSPAPFGQQHMRTQVSLEVVQCCSAATSPMTPPEGAQSFFFPTTFGKSVTVSADTKDAELQVGQQVEFCSVATSPMTPKTPSATAFPELIGRETVQRVKQIEEQKESVQQKSFTERENPAEAEVEITRVFKFVSFEDTTEGSVLAGSQESSNSCLAAGVKDSQVTHEDRNEPSKQQRMGSLDQDITILVTDYGNNEEEEMSESCNHSPEPEMMKIDECEEVGEVNSQITRGKETTPDINDVQIQAEDIKLHMDSSSNVKGTCEKLPEISGTKPIVPESPAPFGCHNMRTQVSLEVVQCQSVATSPMTPPEGDQAFYFPSTFGKCAGIGTDTKDAEVGTQVEFRSVATAPMTPRTPVATTFPEIKKEPSIEEKKNEMEETHEEQVKTECEEEEKEKNEIVNCEDTSEEKCEEPVQEVNWDEKGMTWEVYGAVVEVAVLGSAIQKHLEKQVLKQKRQASLPPPPPLNPSATPLTLEPTQGGSGKGRAGRIRERDGKGRRRRRNPFRQLMENMQQPHCCSRAHSAE